MTLEKLKADSDGWEKKLALAREVIKAAEINERQTIVKYLKAEQAYTKAAIRASVKGNEGSDGL